MKNLGIKVEKCSAYNHQSVGSVKKDGPDCKAE